MSLYEARLQACVALFLILLLDSREVRGPKSPSGRLDLLRPITAAQGLAQLIRIGVNASFPSSSESSKKAKVSTRAHVNHRAASASETSHDSLKGNGKSDRPDEGISALRDSHSHPHYCCSTIAESMLFTQC